jgi:hypothetical protein
MTGSGFGVHRLLAGQWDGLVAWAAGALFIPSLALALGTWSGSNRLFEMVYMFLWYVGPMNQVSALDYMGITSQAVAGGVWRVYLLAAGLLLGLAALGRWRQTHL